jgi:fatty acid desaturase
MYLPCYRLPEAHRLLVEKGLVTRMEVRRGYGEVMKLATSRA